jgi:putative FmdB family regulatory protein
VPIYQYQCEGCGSHWEEIRKLAQRDEPFACKHCDSQCVRIQCPGASVVLKRRQTETGRQEQKAQGSEGPCGINVEGPTDLTIRNTHIANVNRGVVAHPQAQLEFEKCDFLNVKLAVDRREK